MASSGVLENIICTKTPTFDGVCGMLLSIIIFVQAIFAKCWHVYSHITTTWQITSVNNI